MRTVIHSSPGCNCDLDDPDTYLTTGIHGKRMVFFSSLYFYPLRTTLDSRHLPRSSSPPCEDQESWLPGWPSWQNYQGVRSLVWDKNRYTRCKLYFARNAGKNKLRYILMMASKHISALFQVRIAGNRKGVSAASQMVLDLFSFHNFTSKHWKGSPDLQAGAEKVFRWKGPPQDKARTFHQGPVFTLTEMTLAIPLKNT